MEVCNQASRAQQHSTLRSIALLHLCLHLLVHSSPHAINILIIVPCWHLQGWLSLISHLLNCFSPSQQRLHHMFNAKVTPDDAIRDLCKLKHNQTKLLRRNQGTRWGVGRVSRGFLLNPESQQNEQIKSYPRSLEQQKA
jgi:hypothetical protein